MGELFNGAPLSPVNMGDTKTNYGKNQKLLWVIAQVNMGNS